MGVANPSFDHDDNDDEGRTSPVKIVQRSPPQLRFLASLRLSPSQTAADSLHHRSIPRFLLFNVTFSFGFVRHRELQALRMLRNSDADDDEGVDEDAVTVLIYVDIEKMEQVDAMKKTQ